MHKHQDLFLIAIRFNKYLIKLFILVLLTLILFLIGVRFKKCVIKLFPKICFMLKYCHDRYKNQETCYKTVDDFPTTLKFVLD